MSLVNRRIWGTGDARDMHLNGELFIFRRCYRFWLSFSWFFPIPPDKMSDSMPFKQIPILSIFYPPFYWLIFSLHIVKEPRSNFDRDTDWYVSRISSTLPILFRRYLRNKFMEMLKLRTLLYITCVLSYTSETLLYSHPSMLFPSP